MHSPSLHAFPLRVRIRSGTFLCCVRVEPEPVIASADPMNRHGKAEGSRRREAAKRRRREKYVQSRKRRRSILFPGPARCNVRSARAQHHATTVRNPETRSGRRIPPKRTLGQAQTTFPFRFEIAGNRDDSGVDQCRRAPFHLRDYDAVQHADLRRRESYAVVFLHEDVHSFHEIPDTFVERGYWIAAPHQHWIGIGPELQASFLTTCRFQGNRRHSSAFSRLSIHDRDG